MENCRKLVFISLVLALFACSKEKQPLQVDPRNLVGIWELRAVKGGFMAPDQPPIVPGNGDQWRFTQVKFARFLKNALYRQGDYTVSNGTGTDPNTGRAISQLYVDQQPAESFELANDTLRFYYGPIAADGIIQMYVKISDNPGL